MVQPSEESDINNIPQAVLLFNEMAVNTHQITKLVDHMIDKVKLGELSTEKGLGYLEMKYHMLLSYLINLTYIILRKCSGEKIESDPAVDRLIELRTVLEKIRPIDSKLKYQIDKLVKTSVEGAVVEDDPQLYCPNPDNLLSKVQESSSGSEDDSADEANAKRDKSNIYVPPKLAAVHYEDTSRHEMERKMKEQSRRKLLNSSVMKELREEYSDAPMELSSGDHVKNAISKYEQERTEYEENYMTRLPVTKAEKNKRKKMTTIGMLADEVTGIKTKTGSKKRKLKTKKGKGFKKRKL